MGTIGIRLEEERAKALKLEVLWKYGCLRRHLQDELNAAVDAHLERLVHQRLTETGV